MKFTEPHTTIYIDVRQDKNIRVNEDKFTDIVIQEAESVWSDKNLSQIEQTVSEFESVGGEQDASGGYILTNQDGVLEVVANVSRFYPLDSEITNSDTKGSISSAEYDRLSEILVEAQKDVAERVDDRLSEFVQN